jgi:hypothetical protein
MMCVQFARAGHTQQLGHAMMITSTITVVLFTTVVRYLIPLRLKKLSSILDCSVLQEHLPLFTIYVFF